MAKQSFSWGQEPNLLIFLRVFRFIPSCWAPSGCPGTQHNARKDIFRASCGDATKAPHGILEAAAALLTADFLLSIHPSSQHIPPFSCLALLCLSFPILPSSARRGMAHPKYLPHVYEGQGAPRVCREPRHAHAMLSLSSHHAHAKLTRGEKQQQIPPVPVSPPQPLSTSRPCTPILGSPCTPREGPREGDTRCPPATMHRDWGHSGRHSQQHPRLLGCQLLESQAARHPCPSTRKDSTLILSLGCTAPPSCP